MVGDYEEISGFFMDTDRIYDPANGDGNERNFTR